ncbi:MAG TPA: SAM-dependent methyltransferase, partial [Thermomicrobiales bacterium]|nr:SAM-dependent methyltransferase [Thermomicrobiales bacterium]
MPGITLVGLGPGDPAALSQAARDALANGQVFLRTRHHPVVIQQAAPAGRPAFEDLLDSDTPLAIVIERWIDTLLDAARTDAVVYAVPGNPLVGDATVRVLLQRAEEAAVPVRAIPGSGVVDAATAALPPSALASGVQVLDTLDLALAAEHAPFGGGEAALSPLQPLLLTNPGPARVMAAAC